MKERRQQAILEIIAEQEMETQEQLLTALRARGFRCTQATISRDIKELQLVKELTAAGSYRYVISDRKGKGEHDERLRNIFREGVISAAAAQNLVVLKTMPGLANAAAAALDRMEMEGMVGTLAGDDTALLIMQTAQDAEAFCGEIRGMLR
ncbi:MAG TPA: arginine repressor [Candidatus Onthomonas avicola]|nr:arginine repressor [Candidatus Onthomonas avicola]